MPSRDEIQRIAAALNALRPDWPARSLVTFLETHHAHRPYRDLAVAATAVATDARTQTPHLLNEHGHWWAAAYTATGTATGGAAPRPDDPRCEKPGHEHYRIPCRGCRAEELAPDRDDDPTPTLGITPEQAARNAEWAARARAAMTQPTKEPA